MKAAVMMVSQGLESSNKQQGYVLRRLIRRTVLKMRDLEINYFDKITSDIIDQVSKIYQQSYPEVKDIKKISGIITTEIDKFTKTLDRGLNQFNKLDKVSPQDAFNLFQSYGFPFEVTQELLEEKGQSVTREDFDEELKKHQNISRSSTAGMFKGGLADHSGTTTNFY